MCSACKVAAQRVRRGQLRVWVDEFKKTLACVRCGFNDYRALQFHHPDGVKKDFGIGDAVRLGRSVEVIKAEIAKCYCLCANCHHIEHHCEMAVAIHSEPSNLVAGSPVGSPGTVGDAR
jgi:hypothetical protein